MNNEKNFYDILNSKFNERETPYDAENWKSMRAMIDASRAAKRRVLWIAASAVGVLLCAGGVGLYEWNSSNAKSNLASATKSVNNSMQVAVNNNGNQVTNSNTSGATVTNKTVVSDNSQASVASNGTVNNNQSASKASAPLAMTIPIKHKRTKTSGHIASGVTDKLNYLDKQNNSVAQVTGQDNTVANNTALVNQGSSTPKNVPAVKSVTTSKASASAATKTAVHKTDSAAAGDNLPPRFSKEPPIFNGKTNIFLVEAGAEYSGGWQIGSIVQGQGVNPMVGIGYEHYMGTKWFLKTGLQFSTFGHMSPLTYNYQHSVGNVIYDSVITTQRLYFLKIPVQAEYFLGRKKRSIVGFGGSVWFLLGNSGFATTDQQVDNNPPINVVKYSGNAPMSGYSKVDASAHILYGYALSHKFTIYGIMYFELTNMKDNAIFGDNIVQRTRGFQLSASYNLN